MQQRAPQSTRFTKVKGHATRADVEAGRITQPNRLGNHRADRLATLGAAVHAVDPLEVQRANARKAIASSMQMMMIEILAARNVEQGMDGAALLSTR